MAIDSRHIDWINETAGTIGRAALSGTDVNQNFIQVPNAGILLGVAVDPGRPEHADLKAATGVCLVFVMAVARRSRGDWSAI